MRQADWPRKGRPFQVDCATRLCDTTPRDERSLSPYIIHGRVRVALLHGFSARESSGLRSNDPQHGCSRV